MRTGFREHLFWGVSLALVFALLFSRELPLRIASLSAAAFLAGSLLPDIDHPKSKPRKVMRYALVALFFALMLLWGFGELCSILGGFCDYALLLGAVLPFLLVSLVERSIPSHRGLLHSPIAALVYGGICFLIFQVALGEGGLFIGVAGCSGYLAHLLLDFIGDRA